MLSVNRIVFSKNFSYKNSVKHRNFSNKNRIKDVNYQYLQRSKVPTMHFQKSLPRLPVPELGKTSERYLNALRPILTSQQYEEAVKRTNDFISNEGKVLQDKLILKDKANKHTSYISEYWFDLYLRDRAPLPINYNPLIVFQNDERPEYNNQLLRAANLLTSAVRFMLSLRDRVLEPEVYHMNPKKSNTPMFRTVTGLLPEAVSWYGAYLFKAFPLDMSQFDGLFGATRIPKLNKDLIFRDPNSKHVLVQRKGHFYAFDVLDSDGNLLSPTELLANLKHIMDDNSPVSEHPLGVLTCQNRDEWARQRTHLEETGNTEALNKIDSAIFNLILDEETILDDKHSILKQYLHADGTNRWFDKSFSLIVTKDGVSGINFEHSWGDGVAVLRFFQDIYAETTKKPFLNPESRPAGSNVTARRLEFKLDDKSKRFVNKARSEYKEWCDSLSIDYILYEQLTKEACKKYQVSPDCVMQLGFQAAYHLLRGGYAGTYESCSTSAFKHGRTETMRPCTDKTKAFCDGLHMNSSSKDELRALMADCSVYHSELVKQAAMGQGFDRHMFALKKIAEENNLPVPALFDSYEYKFLNKSILSTSTLSSPSVLAGGFGPVAQDGFGIGYSAFADKLGAAVTSYKQHNCSTQYVEALHKSFEDIRKLLSG
ncbi:carnitine O-palmitoyltransferase 2, mitochondrial [Plutella xylostella]|uniref:carnitine O-palmitoyltransferase 2, mitochondrial n=1 Tax=Plutella xylostella TaxID=51655 RepID=UPI002032AFA8|nr:carnitine O-palmitoyltransferase 2, mitochondrial [Plutella xylostella]